MKLPLENIVVVELGHSVAAPIAGLVLAELGATVIKVENPKGGDDARNWGPPFLHGAAGMFQAINRNKYSAALDLKNDAERETLRRYIVEHADIVVQNMRPGSGRALSARCRVASRAQAAADLLQSDGLRRRRSAEEHAGLRPAAAGVRRPDERDRPRGRRAGAHRAVDHRSGRRDVGGDRHSLGAAPSQSDRRGLRGQHLAVRDRLVVDVHGDRDVSRLRQCAEARRLREWRHGALQGVSGHATAGW